MNCIKESAGGGGINRNVYIERLRKQRGKAARVTRWRGTATPQNT